MAYACPSCETDKTIVVLFGEEGSFPYPCLRCAWVPRWLPAPSVQRANAPCPTRGCDGSVCEVYVYNHDRELRQVVHEPCGQCYGGERRERRVRREAGVAVSGWGQRTRHRREGAGRRPGQ